MSERSPTKDWSKADIDSMVALLGEVNASGFYAYVWDDPERVEEDGQKPHPILGASFHPAILGSRARHERAH